MHIFMPPNKRATYDLSYVSRLKIVFVICYNGKFILRYI